MESRKEFHMGEISFDEYKGRAMMVISNGPNDRFPFKFGLKKAKMVVEHIEDIKKWVAEQEAMQASLKADGEPEE
ncbi:MAG: hypothetical protein A3G34_15625 [Candidatus Lindowbacteria bacterium RIFCSPLOWO2_12_FULL_62_27]|nr:MAG: hypothetical protein A3I06_05440 [Candidatus Lindowbacteria bacterium RIFCSPLOWO2_02_FULL_62_12]OGH63280.1 MAG: hypothetical protein A3G34_15625 [Candidatus Lindowbacteria bacterium RIFCSPLOWO2_12_FULL_62_27]